MYKKIMVAGATAAVIVGAGSAALAVGTPGSTTSGQPSASSSSSSSSSSSHAKGSGKNADGKSKKGKHNPLRRAEHGQLVLRKGKDGTVTRQFIRGVVTSVSSDSITVQALDKSSETFAVTKDTKVRTRTDGKGAASSIDKVSKGDRVFVGGPVTGGKPTAANVLDRGTKSK